MKFSFKHQEKGFVVATIIFLSLLIMIIIAFSMTSIMFYRQTIARNTVQSTQSYYAAEAGIEDALWRLNKNPNMSTLSYAMTVNGATTNVTIPSVVGGSTTISSQGTNSNAKRRIQTTYTLDGTNVSFYYGVAVGAGGLQMGSGSIISGNVFANGSISGSGTINNNVVISGTGNSLSGVYVGGDATTYSCLSGASVRNLTYVTGGTHTCTVRGTTTSQSTAVASQPLPIPDSQIADWKTEATAGGVISGNYTMSNGSNQSLGPVKITGNLTVSNNSILTLTGTVYVVGTINISNGAQIKLNSGYGSLGGVLMADGTITLSNNTTFSGSGQTGSYVLVLSNSTSNTAINVNNNAAGAVLYTSAGGLTVSNGVSLVEATGYKVIMSNNSQIQYSTGIVNIYFASGPGAGWVVTNWSEQ